MSTEAKLRAHIEDFKARKDSQGEIDYFQLFGAYFERYNAFGERDTRKPRPIPDSALYRAYVNLHRTGQKSVSFASAEELGISPSAVQTLLNRWEKASGFNVGVVRRGPILMLQRRMRLARWVSPQDTITKSDMIVDIQHSYGERFKEISQKLNDRSIIGPERDALNEQMANLRARQDKEIETIPDRIHYLPDNGASPFELVPVKHHKTSERFIAAQGRSLYPVELLKAGQIARFGPFASVPNGEFNMPNYFVQRLMERIKKLSRYDAKEYQRTGRMAGEYIVWAEQCFDVKDTREKYYTNARSAHYLYVVCEKPVYYGLTNSPDEDIPFRDNRDIRAELNFPIDKRGTNDPNLRPYSDLPIVLKRRLDEWNAANRGDQ